jgi:hypothetical protein
MKIENTFIAELVNQYAKPASRKTNKAENATKSGAVKDKLEISKDAQMLVENNATARDLSAVRRRVESGYYNSEDVLREVAGKMLRDVKSL